MKYEKKKDKRLIAPFFPHQNLGQASHGNGYANIDVLGSAPAAPQVDGPAAEEGEEDGVAPEQRDEKPGGETEVLGRRAPRRVIQVREAARVVDLGRRRRVLLHFLLSSLFLSLSLAPSLFPQEFGEPPNHLFFYSRLCDRRVVLDESVWVGKE